MTIKLKLNQPNYNSIALSLFNDYSTINRLSLNGVWRNKF